MLLYNLFFGMVFTESFGMRKCFQRGIISLVFSLLSFLPAQAKMQVMVSIKPLALIAQEVVGDHADINVLLPITASPHDYPLKMSDHKRLRSADLVIWIGPTLESFLARPLARLPAGKLITTSHLTGLNWPEGDVDDHQHPNHSHGGKDPHIWLDPRNAIVIANTLAARLASLQPDSEREFLANARRFAQSITAVDAHLARKLEPVKAVGFAVYHEGYGHFVRRYGLHQVAYVTYMPERRPGAKHLEALRNVLTKEGKCLFMEPYYSAQGMEEMARSLNLQIGLLDPIGERQVSTYQQLIEQLAQGFLTCLANRRDH